MADFLFVFGYESPEERRINQFQGTDFESSSAVWVDAPDEAAALQAGRSYAEGRVGRLFLDQEVDDDPGWTASGFACWIEQEPLRRFSGIALEMLDRIDA